jgi:hypothetical protein
MTLSETFGWLADRFAEAEAALTQRDEVIAAARRELTRRNSEIERLTRERDAALGASEIWRARALQLERDVAKAKSGTGAVILGGLALAGLSAMSGGRRSR